MPQTRIIGFCGIVDLPLHQNLKKVLDEDEPSDVEETRRQRLVRQSKHLLSPAGKAVLASASSFLTFSKSKRDMRKEKKAEEKNAEEKRIMMLDAHANPINDGWMFSDFFLFHGLFRGLGAQQLWLSCESPADLIAKYQTYEHGVSSNRRVVLDEEILAKSAKYDNFRKLEKDDVLQGFRDNFKSECRQASELGQAVLLIILGHGKEDHGIVVGDPEANPVALLRPRDIAVTARETGVQLTVMMNGCQ